MREVVLDTETTGLNPDAGDRIVEIGCVELINALPTGETFHRRINPQRDMPEDATRISGLTDEMLADAPVFSQVVEEFLQFIALSPLVIHNAVFDMSFINAELKRLDRPPLPPDRAIDTLALARRKFPNAPNNLDALCRRFNVDNSMRTTHGALLDAQLLCEVYLDLTGRRQPELVLAKATPAAPGEQTPAGARPPRQRPTPLPSRLSESDRDAHEAFLKALPKPAVWNR